MSAAAASLSTGPFVNPSSDNFKSRASNCILLTISVICMCVLVVCGVKIVREYSLAKGYQEATCHVTRVDRTPHDIACSYCGAGAKDKTKEKGAGSCVPSSFPCLQVRVEYRSKEYGIHTGVLHPDSIQSNGIYGQCTYDICLKNPAENVKKVEEYAIPWRERNESKERFTCYFNTEKADDIIMEKKHTGNEVVHSMVWPCVIILVCGIIFLHLEKRRRGLNFCGDGMSKRGLADGAEDGNQGNDTILRWQAGKDKAECELITKGGDPVALSSSFSSLDRLHKSDDPLLTNGRPLSKSPDGLKHKNTHGEESSSDEKALLGDSNTNTPHKVQIVIDSPADSPQHSRKSSSHEPV